MDSLAKFSRQSEQLLVLFEGNKSESQLASDHKVAFENRFYSTIFNDRYLFSMLKFPYRTDYFRLLARTACVKMY
jgi:hypothetical protein